MSVDLLAIAAHPDDVEQTCGGTLLKMAEKGYRTGILDLTAGSPGPLRIQLSTKTATITGTLPPGTSAIVISQDGSPGSYGVAVDSTGHFHAKGIPPGKYRLCQTIPGVSLSDDNCTEVTLSEGETVTVDLKPPSAQ